MFVDLPQIALKVMALAFLNAYLLGSREFPDTPDISASRS